jgi:GH25 family lysozyme M1 (1,4-beta-N-acetylmuramidase)
VIAADGRPRIATGAGRVCVPRHWLVRGRVWLLALAAIVQSLAVAAASPAVPCDTANAMGVKGATVDTPARCAFFAHYEPDDKSPDPRIVANLKLKPGQLARSIAVVVGIGKYQNAAYDILDANADVAKLMPFLIGDQAFDEVIVLQDDQATMDNIRYFLRKYAMDRSNFYQGRVRFLFTYSGHGVPIQFFGDDLQPDASRSPSVGLALAATAQDDDYDNLYGLNELRALFNDLAKNTYHFLALINACYGGDLFSLALPGGSEFESSMKGAYAITAGPNDQVVYAAKDGQGSLFFEMIINGITTGDADHDAQDATLGAPNSIASLKGLVRLGALDGYLATTMAKYIGSGAAVAGNGIQHHWVGPVEPFNLRANGAFFFFQKPRVAAAIPPGLAGTTFKAELRTTADFVPSLNQLATKIQPQPDGFEALRALGPTVRGIDISHFNGQIDWAAVAGQKIGFAYIKATQSSENHDALFAHNWGAAKESGIARGAYHTFSFCESAADQFANIKATIEPDASDLPIAIDIELFPGQETSNITSIAAEAKCALASGNGAIRDNVGNLVDMIEQAYQKLPVIYGNDYLIDTVLTTAVTSKASVWRPKYGLAAGAPAPPWTLWQFSENEKVAGISGTVDMNVLSKSP